MITVTTRLRRDGTSAALTSDRPAAEGRPRRARSQLEPWRDWLLLTLINHAILLGLALSHPGRGWLLLGALPLGLGLGTATLTVLHDAGHRRFARAAWPNVLATQTAAPAGLWVGHWTLKHRVHHRVTQVYPLDEATRASGLVRLHPAAAWRGVHRWQHLYAWALYSLAWAGELRSQLTYLRTGRVTDTRTPHAPARAASFVVEKALCLIVLAPYAWLLGLGDLALLLLTAMTVASLFAAVATVVGHINLGLEPTATVASGADWADHLRRTTASFSLDSLPVRWLTGGLTHHLVHHLQPVVPRGQLPARHRALVADLAARGVEAVVLATVHDAVSGHYRRLKELGRPEGHRAGPGRQATG